MPTAPPSMTAAPTSPDRSDRSTFTARSIALDDWRKNNNVPEMTAALANIYANAVDTYNNALAAAANAALAIAVAGATKWVSGTIYSADVCAWSPINGQTYRRAIAGGGTTDPSLDPTNWSRVPVALGGDAANNLGYLDVPPNSQSAPYTAVLADSGKCLLHPSADTTARTFTIPANSAVAYPIGTALTIVNQASAGVVTIVITTDTMRLAGVGTTGSRTLGANGIATAIKIMATEWLISGTGLT